MENQKKEAKVRTSITIDPAVLDAARKHCEANNISVSAFIETSVASALAVPCASVTVVEVA